MREAARGLSWLIGRASTATLKQIEATTEQTAKVSLAALPAEMGLLELEQTMGIDPSLRRNDWFIPVMDQAARVFVEANRDTPGLPPVGTLLYDLPYFQTLTASRIAEINRERVESSGAGEMLSSGVEADMRTMMEEEEVGSGKPRAERTPAQQPNPLESEPLQPREQPSAQQSNPQGQEQPQEPREQPEPPRS